MVEQQEPTAYVNPYKFNAKELDSEFGLYYYGAIKKGIKVIKSEKELGKLIK